jgi:hypothetical protein
MANTKAHLVFGVAGEILVFLSMVGGIIELVAFPCAPFF